MDKEYEQYSDMLTSMNEYTRTLILERSQKQLWENTYIYKQIEKRKQGHKFSLEEHIRAMVYAMLSGGGTWCRVLDYTDLESGKIKEIDGIFCQYDYDKIKALKLDEVKAKIGKMGLLTYSTGKQIDALVNKNIDKLLKWNKDNDGIDSYYDRIVKDDHSKFTLVNMLAAGDKQHKMKQLGIPLTCEYLRNVGYDIPKPDRHICRILGNDHLGSLNKKLVLEEAYFKIMDIAKNIDKTPAEIDYILWSYCATGFGEICLKNKIYLKCKNCVVRQYCKK